MSWPYVTGQQRGSRPYIGETGGNVFSLGDYVHMTGHKRNPRGLMDHRLNPRGEFGFVFMSPGPILYSSGFIIHEYIVG